jgi:CheY-like chemotaxis protein
MPETPVKILLVEDEPSIRISMSVPLSEAGYYVRLAEDGFSALRGIHREMPDVLLSELNMPGMTGFELLSVVRRKFPAIRTIAMSGEFDGNQAQAGIAADAFYAKGRGIDALILILQSLPTTTQRSAATSSAMEPLWIHGSRNTSPPDARVTIACPECLRTFLQALDGPANRMQSTTCTYCHIPIHFILAQSVNHPPVPALQNISAEAEPAHKTATQYYY